MIVTCPHCGEPIIIEQLNCGIFRHGVIIKKGTQMDPHLKKEACEKLINKKKIYGCGKPFRIIEKMGKLEIEICDYI